MWRSLSFFCFSLITTLIIYTLTVGSSAKTELSHNQEIGSVIEMQAIAPAQEVKSDVLVQTDYIAPTPKIEIDRVVPTQQEIETPIQSAIVPTQTVEVAQAATTIEQGQEISLNGRRFSVAWTQWNQGDSVRTGISDTGAMQTLGIELLSTNQPDVQPVLWFPADPNRPITLQARLIGSYRYIDITDLIAQAGARSQVLGNALNIDFPQPKILNVRQGNQTWGKRLVVDLDRPVFWQVSQAPKQGAVIIEGLATSELLSQYGSSSTAANATQTIDEDDLGGDSSAPSSKPGSRVFSLQSDGKITKILMNLPTAYGVQVSSIGNPNRLAIDIRADAMKQRDIAWTQGITWRQQFVRLNRGLFPVNFLEINPRSPGVALKPITTSPNTLEGSAPIVTTARAVKATAAINGGFFNRNNRLPLGAIRVDNRWLSSPILNRGAIAWNDSGQVKIGRLTLREVVTTSRGQKQSISFVNSGYLEAGMARYTPDWGRNYKTLTDNETIVLVQNNSVVQQIKAGNAGGDTFPIPSDGYLLAIRGNGASASALMPGTQVSIQTATVPADFINYPNVLGAGPLLIQNGRVVLNAASEKFSKAFQQQMASRSAIATTKQGTIIIAAIHNRVGGRGSTLGELAQILQKLGAVDALNLDGGSSTSLSLGGQLIDRSPVTAARVHNGIGVFVSSAR